CYIARGSVAVNGQVYAKHRLLVFGPAEDPKIVAQGKATLMLLGGEPLGERFIWWNFVSSRKERIEQAKEDWKQGRIVLPPDDSQAFIPLPDDPYKPNPSPEPLS